MHMAECINKKAQLVQSWNKKLGSTPEPTINFSTEFIHEWLHFSVEAVQGLLPLFCFYCNAWLCLNVEEEKESSLSEL